MIQFYCPNCRAYFEVDDNLAGERVACSECDTHFQVPMPPPQPVQAPPQKLSPRQRRLMSDFDRMKALFTYFPLIHLERVQGNPPELYVVSYRIRGIERLRGEEKNRAERAGDILGKVHACPVCVISQYDVV